MSCDVEISIFGKVSDPEAIFELAQSASSEGRINYLEQFGAEAFLPMLEAAESENRAVVLTRGRTTDFFEDVRNTCKEAGLSYVVRYGESGAEGFHAGFSWHPGMKGEAAFLMNGDKPVLTVDSLRSAANLGIEAVTDLVEETARRNEAGPITIEPGFAEAYREYSGYGAEALAR